MGRPSRGVRHDADRLHFTRDASQRIAKQHQACPPRFGEPMTSIPGLPDGAPPDPPRTESEDRFFKAFHFNPVGMLISRTDDGRLLDVNQTFCRMMGYEREELIGNTTVGLGLWADSAARVGVIETFRCDGRVRDRLAGCVTRSGETKLLQVSVDGIKLNGVDCFIASVMDVTARMDAEARVNRATEELRRANERLALAQKAAGAGTWDWDIGTGELVWSEQLYRLFGLDPERDSASFASWRGRLHPEDRELAERRIQAAIRDRKRLANEYRVIHPSGEVRWIEALGDTTYDESGVALRMSGICIDVTARRALEGAAHEAEQRYRLLAAAAFEGIAISEDGRLLDVNEQLATMFGYTREEMIGREIAELVHPEDRAHALVGVRTDTPRVVEHRGVRKDGTLIHVVVHGQIMETAGRLVRVAAVQDITARKRAEAALLAATTAAEKANAAKSRFLAAASHDLRQPIQAMGLFIESLRKTPLDARQQHIALSLERSTEVLGQLLDALLDISRLDAGVVRQQRVRLDPAEVCRQLERECAHLAREKGLRYRTRLSRRLGPVTGDPGLLLGLLRNLASNAIRYTERGRVLVTARARRGHLLLQVWDTGIGIAPEHLEPIFDEFYQVANAQCDRTQGLGLGLSIVRRLAQLLGYEVACRSRLGRGSVFEVRIPRPEDVDSAVTVGAATSSAAVPSRLVGLRVVLVEDDALVAAAWREWLESLGARTRVFTSASQALAAPDIGEADLYLCDLRLPGSINGIELLEMIQARARRRIAGVIVTGDTGADQIDRQAGAAWPVLHKPVDLEVLLAAIAAARGAAANAAPERATASR
jgi:PAS domain S-box-containing protein